MAKNQIRRLPIVNDAYKVSGIVLLGDVSVRGSECDFSAELNTNERWAPCRWGAILSQ